MSLTSYDYGALIVSGSLLIIYNVVFFSSLSSRPPKQLALNLKNAEHWIDKHASRDDATTCVLAIQTLRNTIMVAVFVGGYTLTIAYNISDALDVEDATHRFRVRSLILAVLLFSSFLCWASVIRHASHLGYMIGTMGYDDPNHMTAALVQPAKADDSATSTLVTEEAPPERVVYRKDSVNDNLSPEQRILQEKMEMYISDKKFMIRKSKVVLRHLLVAFR